MAKRRAREARPPYGAAATAEPATKTVAIYCRKSGSEGLQSEFNTLDAQRLACEQFAASQVHEQWVVSPERYDDGGFSGGTTERPALARLMDDVRAGKVQIIAVYKLDRLSRSLTDFVTLLQLLEEHGAAFVSVTQQFNTATPMGRLMLHILICFAQFERENAIERIRDKVAATKRQGRWCGGPPPLGYDVAHGGGRLLVNEPEAEQVRTIFALYLEHRSLIAVLNEVEARGWRNKAWTTRKGTTAGGRPFHKSGIARLLRNILYTARIRYQDEIIPAEHEPIVDRNAFDQVQALLTEQARSGGRQQKTRHRALLQDLLTCAHCGCRMTYTWTRRGGATGKDSRVHGYYSCHRSRERGAGTCPMPHLPAYATEQLLIGEIAAICRDEALAETVIDRAAADHRQAREAAEQALTEAQAELEASLAAQRRQDGPRTRDAVRSAEAQTAAAVQTLAELAEPLDPAAARQALARFEELWAELAHDERRQLLRSLIQGVRIDGEQGRLHIDFATTGIAALARQDEAKGEAEPQEGAETPEPQP